MKLAEVLAPFKHFEMASEKENLEILRFFHSMTMDTPSMSLRYDRGDDFFAYLYQQCEKNFVITMKNDDGSIHGLGSISLIRHYINGRSEVCAYLGDLRISPKLSSRVRVKWKSCYAEVISKFSEIDEFEGVRYLYSAILDDNLAAMKSLLKNNDRIIYHPLTPYETINIYGKNPLLNISKSNLQIQDVNFEQVKHLLFGEMKSEGFHYDFSNSEFSELDRRLRTWNNFSHNSFMAVTRSSGEVVATCAPWICDTKKLVVTRISGFYKFLGNRIFPLFGIPKMKEGDEIKILYLTHLTFKDDLTAIERTRALSLMINQVLKTRRSDFHLVSFFKYPCWDLGKLPFFYQSTKATLYQVMSDQQVEKEEYIKLAGHPPAFTLEVS